MFFGSFLKKFPRFGFSSSLLVVLFGIFVVVFDEFVWSIAKYWGRQADSCRWQPVSMTAHQDNWSIHLCFYIFWFISCMGTGANTLLALECSLGAHLAMVSLYPLRPSYETISALVFHWPEMLVSTHLRPCLPDYLCMCACIWLFYTTRQCVCSSSGPEDYSYARSIRLTADNVYRIV